MELVKGRPANVDGRKDREIRTYDFLDKLGIEYMRVDHDAAFTMEACEAIDVALGTKMCKNLFLCNGGKTKFYMLLTPGDKPFKTKYLSGQIDSGRLSFASEEKMLEYLDIEPGAVSLMGLMNDKENHVRLLVDKDVYESEYLGCHPCVNTSSLRMKTEDAFGTFLKATGHEMQIVELPWENAL